MNLEDYTKFVVMTEDALTTKNIAKMKWLGLESRRQAIQHEMVYLERAIQQSNQCPEYAAVCEEYEASIRANLKQMKDVIVELRLNKSLSQQVESLRTLPYSGPLLHTFMGEEVYAHYCSGGSLDYLPFDVKKALDTKLKIMLDETI